MTPNSNGFFSCFPWRNLLWLPAVIAAGLAAVVPPPAAGQACPPDDTVEFVCDIPGPEDLIEVRETPWVFASSRIADDDGFINVVHRSEHTVTTLYPGGSSAVDFDAATYGDYCPGPPTATFQPHGIGLRYGEVGDGVARTHTLYVVGHGERESVEVFAVDASAGAAAPPTLTWIGCVVAPDGASLNSVSPLPGPGFVATDFRFQGGRVLEWSPPAGWSDVPGTEMAGPNGIEASADGQWLFIGGWGAEELVRVSRGQEPVQRDAVSVGFHIDNVRWAPDGSILVGGQYGSEVASIGGCLNGGDCTGVASRAARIDPYQLTVEPLVDYPSNSRFPFATVAIEIDDEIWLGGIAGGETIARFPAE